MTMLDVAVRDFKNAINKKALCSGISRSKLLDYMDRDRRLREQQLKAAWALNRKIL